MKSLNKRVLYEANIFQLQANIQGNDIKINKECVAYCLIVKAGYGKSNNLLFRLLRQLGYPVSLLTK